MRCSKIIEETKRRCVRKSQTDRCYQHRNSLEFPNEILDIIYGYTVDDLPEEITKDLWNRLQSKNQLKSFLRSYELPVTLNYEDFILFLILRDVMEPSKIIRVLEGLLDISYEDIIIDHVAKNANPDLALYFAEKVEIPTYYTKHFYDRYIPKLELTDSLIEKYLTRLSRNSDLELFKKAKSEETKNKILEKYGNNQLFFERYFDGKYHDENLLRELPFSFKKGFIIPFENYIIYDNLQNIVPTNEILKSIRYFEDFREIPGTDFLRKILDLFTDYERSQVATDILNQRNPNKFHIYHIDILKDYGADMKEFRKKVRSMKNPKKDLLKYL